MDGVHQKLKAYTCSSCTAEFQLKQQLEVHKKTKHNPNIVREFKCHHCEQSFTTLQQYRSHQELQHPQPSTSTSRSTDQTDMPPNKTKSSKRKRTEKSAPAARRPLTGTLLIK